MYQCMADVVFEQILEMNRKYKFDINYVYLVNRFIDDENTSNTEHELSVRICTPSDRTSESQVETEIQCIDKASQ